MAPLDIALQSGRADVSEALVELGADVDAVGSVGLGRGGERRLLTHKSVITNVLLLNNVPSAPGLGWP